MCLYLSNELAQKEPKNHQAYLLKSSALAGLGKFSEAYEAAERAYYIDKTDPTCILQLGAYKFLVGNPAESLKLLNQVLEKDPEHPSALGWLILVLTLSPDPAIRDGNRAKKLALKLCENKDAKKGEALLLLALAYGENGEFEKAILEGQQALKLLGPKSRLIKTCRIAIESFQKKTRFADQKQPFQMTWDFETLRFIGN